VDAVVQSTDKNFLVPVGGSVVTGPKERPGVVEGVARMYPGRASLGPSLDLIMTFLEMGASGWRGLLEERREGFEYLRGRLEDFAQGVGERVLDVPGNSISLAMTLSGIQAEPRRATQLGSMLFRRNVTGCRVFCPAGKTAEVDGQIFINFGSHADAYPHAYLNVAAAVGMKKGEVDLFIERLSKCWKDLAAKLPQSPTAPQ
jgi:O-phospho-L-seryl-tRNASec:L-selenocysteinyl-tRNA synthase